MKLRPLVGYLAYIGGGEIFRKGEFHGENFAIKKLAKISPLAKFSWPVTNNFTVNSDASTANSNVRRCTSGGKGPRCVCFHPDPARRHQESPGAYQQNRGTIHSLPGNIRNHLEPTRKQQQASGGGEISPFRNYARPNCPLANLSPRCTTLPILPKHPQPIVFWPTVDKNWALSPMWLPT